MKDRANKMMDRLYRIYPFKKDTFSNQFYRNVRVKQLALLLHRISWDDDEVDRVLEMIRYVEELGIGNFTMLCNLVANKRMDEFINFLGRVVREST